MRLLQIQGRRRLQRTENLWQTIKNFINSIYKYNTHNNYIFTRSELISHLKDREFTVSRSCYGSMDQYRNILSKAGYIKTIGRGIYEIFKLIPDDLSILDARNESDKFSMFGSLFGLTTASSSSSSLTLSKHKPKDFLSKKDFQI